MPCEESPSDASRGWDLGLRGIGVDLVDVARFGRALARHGHRFERRWFDEEELAQPGDRELVLARSFAVKEAVWKALRVHRVEHPAWREIVATVCPRGTVVVRLKGALRQEAEEHRVRAIHASTVVREGMVLATAMVEGLSRPSRVCLWEDQPCAE
jgi:holo-[acyl-carrier protein] synthase